MIACNMLCIKSIQDKLKTSENQDCNNAPKVNGRGFSKKGIAQNSLLKAKSLDRNQINDYDLKIDLMIYHPFSDNSSKIFLIFILFSNKIFKYFSICS